jgi:subtilisin family serine protease
MYKKLVGIFVMMLLITNAIPNICGNIIKNDIYIDTQNLKFVLGEFIVKIKENIKNLNPSLKILNEKYQVSSIEKVFRNSENTILDNIYLFRVPEESDILSIVNDYSSNPNVLYAEPNGFAHLCGIPNDENFSKQWALHNTGQTGGTPDADIDAVEAWDIETGSPDVVIAIIDTGVDYTHPDLEDNIWSNEDEIPDNGIDDDGNGYIDDVIGWDWWYDDNDPLDEYGHGTICAGIAGAVGNNGIGISGVCWDCKIMSLKITNETAWLYYTDIAEAIQYAADNGAHVISMSFVLYNNMSYIWDAVNYANDKGVFMCAACGNDDVSEKTYPAAYDNVIAVGGTDHNDSRMYFYCEHCGKYHGSNYGSWVDVAAPAQEIYSTMPTYYVYYNKLGMKQNYDTLQGGTSFACPHVAGLAALILSKYPSLSLEKLTSRILEKVDPYDSEFYIGTGRINAHKSVKRSRDRAVNTPFFRLFEEFPNAFPILRQLLGLI